MLLFLSTERLTCETKELILSKIMRKASQKLLLQEIFFFLSGMESKYTFTLIVLRQYYRVALLHCVRNQKLMKFLDRL